MASSGWQGNKDFPYNNTDLKCNLRIDSITHSGDSLRVTGAVGAVCPHGSSAYYAWYVYPVYVTPQNGGEQTLLTNNEYVYGGGNNGLDSAKTVGFDVTIPAAATATSANFTVHVRMNNDTAIGDLTWPLSFDASATAPTGLNVTNIQAGENNVKADVSVSGWGGAGDANSRYRELQVWAGNMSGDRRYQSQYGNSTSGNITCNNNSSGSLNILPNTKYWVGGYASNGTLNTGSVNFGTVVTKVPSVTGSQASADAHSVTINWNIGNQGGEKDIKIEYKLDSGSWVEVTTVSGSGTKSGQFTISNLLPNSTHTVVLRSSAVGGAVSGGATLTVSTTDTPEKLYGSVNGARKRGVKAYCSVNGTRKRIKKIYGSVNNARKLVYEDPNLI